MITNSMMLLYVSHVATSVPFYAGLLGTEPVEASPGFALFMLPSGLELGLWGRDGVEPAPVAGGGGSEIGFAVAGAAEVDAIHADWAGKAVPIVLPPTDLDFGRSFVACDPDGHRLRVYCPAAAG